MMIGLGFRECVFGSLLHDERGCMTGPSSLPCSERGYSPSPSVADVRSNRLIYLNNCTVAVLAGRLKARRKRKIYLGDYSSRAACCPLEGCLAADANQFPSDSFRAASG
jgi:hypothetical protein